MIERKELIVTSIIGLLLAIYLATVVHNLYTQYPNIITAILAPVNESVFEHSKIFFTVGTVIFTLIYFIIGKEFKNYIPAALLSIVLMTLANFLFIPLNAILPLPIHVLAITLTILILLFGFLLVVVLSLSERDLSERIYDMSALYLMVFLLIVLFTFYPPYIESIFMDPTTGTYGIKG